MEAQGIRIGRRGRDEDEINESEWREKRREGEREDDEVGR